MKPLRKQGIIIISILSLILVACGGATEETSEEEVVVEEVTETLDSPAVTTAGSVTVSYTHLTLPRIVSV